MHAFRELVIDLLDDPHGIDEAKYQKLIQFADINFPNMCDDIWSLTDSGESNDGLRVWLDEGDVSDLRHKQ